MSDEHHRLWSPDLRLAIVLFAVAMLVGASGIGYAVYSYGATQNSIISTENSIARKVQQQNVIRDTRWCTVFRLLTSKPVTKPPAPKTNPSRQASYELYLDFVQLRKEFECPPP